MPLCGGVFVNIALTQHDWLNKVSNTIPNTANRHSVRNASGMGSNVLKLRPLLPGHETCFTSLSMDSLEPVSQPGPQS